MSQSNVILVGGTKMVERHLRTGLPEGGTLAVLRTMDQAMRRMANDNIALLVLGPTMRRALAMVTTIRRDSEHKDVRLIVVYRDDQRNDVKRHLKGRYRADEYVMQSKASKELGGAVGATLKLSNAPDTLTEHLQELPLDAIRNLSADVTNEALDVATVVTRTGGGDDDPAEAEAGVLDVIEALKEAELTPAGSREVLQPFDVTSDSDIDVLDEVVLEDGLLEDVALEDSVLEDVESEEVLTEDDLEDAGDVQAELLDGEDLLDEIEDLEEINDELPVFEGRTETDVIVQDVEALETLDDLEELTSGDLEALESGDIEMLDSSQIETLDVEDLASEELEELEDLEEIELVEDLDADLLSEASVDVTDAALCAADSADGANAQDAASSTAKDAARVTGQVDSGESAHAAGGDAGAVRAEAAQVAEMVDVIEVIESVEVTADDDVQELMLDEVEELSLDELEELDLSEEVDAAELVEVNEVQEVAAIKIVAIAAEEPSSPAEQKAESAVGDATADAKPADAEKTDAKTEEKVAVTSGGVRRRPRHNSASFMAHNIDELSNLIGNLKSVSEEVDRLEIENDGLRAAIEKLQGASGTAKSEAAATKHQTKYEALQAENVALANRVAAAEKATEDARGEAEVARKSHEEMRAELTVMQERFKVTEQTSDGRAEALRKTGVALAKIAEELAKKA